MTVWACLHSVDNTESTVTNEQRKEMFESELDIELGKTDGSCRPNFQQ